jgi:membrane associated rhomboid family serine protease
MSEGYGATGMQLQKPGPALRGVLIGAIVIAIVGALMVNLVHGGPAAFELLIFSPSQIMRGELWRFFTAGVLSPPGGPGSLSHILFSLLGLYFLSPDLERRWGSRKFLSFLGTSLVVGYVLAFVVDAIPLQVHGIHTPAAYGMYAAITGVAVAWARENAGATVRLMFVLPVKGSSLVWLTIGFCVLSVIFADPGSEGYVAPFGGVLTGLVLGGSPSPIRTAYLNWKLTRLRKKSGGLSAAAMLRPTGSVKSASSPTLRVVKGGLDDGPPRDKRYLN